MPFIPVSPRKKRGGSSWIRFPSRRKVRVVERGNFDGAASTQDGIKARFSRRSSRVMSFLGISRDDREEDRVSMKPVTETLCSDQDEISSTIIKYRGHHSRQRSSSSPGLPHRLSHKLSSTFGHPTVVHRTSLRSRPSVRSMQDVAEAVEKRSIPSPPGFSATSTWISGSGSSPAQVSTNPTSDGLSSSPMRSAGRNVAFNESSRHFSPGRDPFASRLASISETLNVVVPSIITVEATAAAKIFFETHFKHLLSGHKPRSQRRKDLEAALEACNWSHIKRYKARAQFIRQENELLRQDRVLKSKTSATKKEGHVSIAGYEIVKVLGKGSFGVVRLVKEKAQLTEEPTLVTDHDPTRKVSKTDLAFLKSAARDTLPLLASRRKGLTKLRKEVYAMKVIRKSDMLRNSQEGHLKAERDFLVASENSRWIVPLIAAFQDDKNLYLVMDYCIGGDFLGLLIRKNTLSEDVTRWYIAEMILCVEEAHRLRWIHRDVKPDNFLIGADGHLKISDFGLAFDGDWSHDQAFFHNHRHSLMEKLGIQAHGDDQDRSEAPQVNVSQSIGKVMAGGEQNHKGEKKSKFVPDAVEAEPIVDWRDKNQWRKLARSVVGTSQYMAPEVIRGELYDGRCDWWSIGIILYECLFGFTPFACESRQETKLKILTHRTTLAFPDDRYGFPSISSGALDLMRRMLREKEERLSSPKYHLNDYAYSQGEEFNTYHIHGPADKSSKDYQGRHVYPDDADDIKAHPWFKNTNWAQIHRKKPPFVPKVRDWEDTKYFDDDGSISDLGSSSSEEFTGPAAVLDENGLGKSLPTQDPQIFEHGIAAAAQADHPLSEHQEEEQPAVPSHPMAFDLLPDEQDRRMLDAIANGAGVGQLACSTVVTNANMVTVCHPQLYDGVGIEHQPPTHSQARGETDKPKKTKKERKRPRDKILRDPATAKLSLDIRRKSAFLGYGYRRPKGVRNVLERVEDELEAEKAGLLGPQTPVVDNKMSCAGDEDDDGRRDSAIAGIDVRRDLVPGAGMIRGDTTLGAVTSRGGEVTLPMREGGEALTHGCITPKEDTERNLRTGTGGGMDLSGNGAPRFCVT